MLDSSVLYSVDMPVRSSLSPLGGVVVPVPGWLVGFVGFVSSSLSSRVVFGGVLGVFLTPSIFVSMAGLVIAWLTVCVDFCQDFR